MQEFSELYKWPATVSAYCICLITSFSLQCLQ